MTVYIALCNCYQYAFCIYQPWSRSVRLPTCLSVCLCVLSWITLNDWQSLTDYPNTYTIPALTRSHQAFIPICYIREIRPLKRPRGFVTSGPLVISCHHSQGLIQRVGHKGYGRPIWANVPSILVKNLALSRKISHALLSWHQVYRLGEDELHGLHTSHPIPRGGLNTDSGAHTPYQCLSFVTKLLLIASGLGPGLQ